MQEKKIILGVQYLRGLAALGVVLCHYGSSLKEHTLLAKAFSYGQNGVQVFFLISGFIIVYSLTQANYQPKQFFRFLAKRSLRIDPLYYATIILTLLLFKILSAIPSFKGSAIPFMPGQFLAHVFYVVPFTKYSFYDHVFWTLCIEFQFYILIGLLYFLIDSHIYKGIFLVTFSLTCLINFPNSYYLVFTYAPIFCLGISMVGILNKVDKFRFVLPVVFLALIAYRSGIEMCLLLSGCCMVILFVNVFNKAMFMLGQISYSLYLTHTLAFIITVGILKKTSADLSKHELIWLLFEVIIAIIVAYIFYQIIEKPSLRISKRIFYKKIKSEVD